MSPQGLPALFPAWPMKSSEPRIRWFLIPESFTLACETEIINRSENAGIFDLKIFSPSSLIREIHELTGHGTKKPISGDGQNMIISQLLHHHRDNLKYYRDSAAQPTLAAKIAAQIDDFTRARLDPAFLRGFQPASRRTGAKIEDVALIWDGYRKVLEKGFEDTVGQWMSAVSLIQKSGIVRNSQLLIYGFDYITHDILNLVRAAAFGDLPEMSADEVVIGLISDDVGPDRDIFRSANDSVKALEYDLNRMGIIPDIQQEENIPLPDPGISYVEKTIYALGKFQDERTYQQKNRLSFSVKILSDWKKKQSGRLIRSRFPIFLMFACITPGIPISNASMHARR